MYIIKENGHVVSTDGMVMMAIEYHTEKFGEPASYYSIAITHLGHMKVSAYEHTDFHAAEEVFGYIKDALSKGFSVVSVGRYVAAFNRQSGGDES